MQAQQKAQILRQVIELLDQADALQQKAIGSDTDVSYEYHNRIQDLIDDIAHDVMEFDVVE